MAAHGGAYEHGIGIHVYGMYAPHTHRHGHMVAWVYGVAFI